MKKSFIPEDCAFIFITAVYFCIYVWILALRQPGFKSWCFGSAIRGFQRLKGPFSRTQSYSPGLLFVVVTGRLMPAAGFSVSMRQQYVGSLRRFSGSWRQDPVTLLKKENSVPQGSSTDLLMQPKKKDCLFFNFFFFSPAITQTRSINCDVIHP